MFRISQLVLVLVCFLIKFCSNSGFLKYHVTKDVVDSLDLISEVKAGLVHKCPLFSL